MTLGVGTETLDAVQRRNEAVHAFLTQGNTAEIRAALAALF